MVNWTQNNGTLHAQTGREGALSSVGHDLDLAVGRFAITRDGTTLRGEAQADSLTVAGVIREGGRIDRPGLSKLERMKVERSISKDVLQAGRHPTVTFEAEVELSQAAEQTFSGTLTLCGRSNEVEVTVHRTEDGWHGSFVVHQPDFGMKPYRAFLGALTVHPDVKIVFDLSD